MNRKQIENYLENECSFRDYTFKPAKAFGVYNERASINLLNPTRWDLESALETFVRDGFSTIVIYLGKKAGV